MTGHIIQIGISLGGLPKRPVPEAVFTPLVTDPGPAGVDDIILGEAILAKNRLINRTGSLYGKKCPGGWRYCGPRCPIGSGLAVFCIAGRRRPPPHSSASPARPLRC